MQACKPGSVPEINQGLIIYLAPASQPGSIGLPIPTSKKWMGGAAHVRDLFGLSTRKVCRAPDVATRAVSSYLAFSL